MNYEHAEAAAVAVFVAEVVRAHELLVADELPTPVALLAGLARRTQVVDRRRDGPRVGVRGRGPDLSQARELGADVPAGTRADVALRAGDARVGRAVVGDPLGRHDVVTHLSAERGGLARLVRLVRPDAHQQQDDEPSGQETEGHRHVPRAGEIHPELAGLLSLTSPLAASLAPDPERHADEADHEQQGDRDVVEPDVGRGARREDLQHEQEQTAEERDDDEAGSQQGQPVRVGLPDAAPVLVHRCSPLLSVQTNRIE